MTSTALLDFFKNNCQEPKRLLVREIIRSVQKVDENYTRRKTKTEINKLIENKVITRKKEVRDESIFYIYKYKGIL